MGERAPYAWWSPAGFAAATVGLLLAAYAYTPPRVYDIAFLGVAALGFLLMFGGIVAAGWARASAGRKRARRRSPTPRSSTLVGAGATRVPVEATPKDAPAAPEPQVAATSGRGRSGLAFLARRRGGRDAEAAPKMRHHVRCPRCDRQFSVDGALPLPVSCACGHSGTLTK